MSSIFDKLVKSVISEIAEGLFFGICLYITSLLPEDSIRQSIITSIIILWVITGISTPIVIFVGLKEKSN